MCRYIFLWDHCVEDGDKHSYVTPDMAFGRIIPRGIYIYIYIYIYMGNIYIRRRILGR